MRHLIAVAALTTLTTAASAQTIEVGTASWAKLPLVKARPSRIDHAGLASQVETILRSGQCILPRQSARRFDLDVPYAVQLDPQGKVLRVVVSELKCRPIERLAGEVVLARSDAGDYLPTGESKPRWYASAINFNLS